VYNTSAILDTGSSAKTNRKSSDDATAIVVASFIVY